MKQFLLCSLFVFVIAFSVNASTLTYDFEWGGQYKMIGSFSFDSENIGNDGYIRTADVDDLRFKVYDNGELLFVYSEE